MVLKLKGSFVKGSTESLAKQPRAFNMIKNRKMIPATFTHSDLERLNVQVEKTEVKRTKYIEKAVMRQVSRDEKRKEIDNER